MSTSDYLIEDYRFWRDQVNFFSRFRHYEKGEEIYRELVKRKAQAIRALREYANV